MNANGADPQSELAVSVLLPATNPWPAASLALESLLSQTHAPTFEVLVLDGHGQALASAPCHSNVRLICLPGYDSFALRAEGIAQAHGAVVAITEDHCIMPADWIASIAAAHRNDASPAIVGAVSNHPDSAAKAIDRANFILTFAGQTPGRLHLGHRRLPVPTNLSFKRRAVDTRLAPGELEYRWLAELLHQRSVGTAESVVVRHNQSWGTSTWAVHLASGRSYGAAVHDASFRTRARWWLTFPIVPLRLFALVIRELAHGAGGTAFASADVMCAAALIVANVCGQVLGALWGPGTSRHRL